MLVTLTIVFEPWRADSTNETRRVARVLLKWKHFQAGGLGPP